MKRNGHWTNLYLWAIAIPSYFAHKLEWNGGCETPAGNARHVRYRRLKAEEAYGPPAESELPQ
ncbi:hypothetical protein CVN76_13270 [Bacillus sp. mrc49]|nr:hypothetical protein CVN76_13270 [Bacillus sp. mrc49]